jgi:stromal membrane-associated protein
MIRYWEANLRDKKPSESNMEMWIRAKYEQKRWAMKGPIPDPSTLGGDEDNDQVYSIAPQADIYIYIYIFN